MLWLLWLWLPKPNALAPLALASGFWLWLDALAEYSGSGFWLWFPKPDALASLTLASGSGFSTMFWLLRLWYLASGSCSGPGPPARCSWLDPLALALYSGSGFWLWFPKLDALAPLTLASARCSGSSGSGFWLLALARCSGRIIWLWLLALVSPARCSG